MEALTVIEASNHDTPSDHLEYIKREFSRRLREAREKRYPRVRQKDWATAIGLTDVRQYQRWEHGEQLPSLERLPKIVEVTGVDFSDLFEPPGSLTRDGMRTHFDDRMDELERRLFERLEANFYAINERIVDLRSLIESRLPRS